MIPPETAPDTAVREDAFWDYNDLFMFIGLAFASLFAALALVRFVPFLHALSLPYALVTGQLIWYLLVFGALAAILRLRYGRPFWPSLAWRTPRRGDAIGSLVLGPVLAIALGLLGTALRTPQIPLPFQGMLKQPALIALFAILVAFIGPICEELAFRGFIMPLLIRSWGAIAGIVVTGLLFGGLHSFEYPDWRYILLISTAGIVFGWRRYRTESTVNSAIMHGAFNLTQFAALIASQHFG